MAFTRLKPAARTSGYRWYIGSRKQLEFDASPTVAVFGTALSGKSSFPLRRYIKGRLPFP